ncbi:MAG: cell division protein ZipA [Gammaproteobacteria bacterium]
MMDIQIIALLVAFGIVSFVAAIVIRLNRYYARLIKQLQKEPSLWETAENKVKLQVKKSPEPIQTPTQTEKKHVSVVKPETSVAIQVEQQSPATPSVVVNEKPVATPQFNPRPLFNVSPREFIVLMLMAKPEVPYTGYELLQVLLAAGLRFGKMNVFHRHEKISGQGEILFSLASAVEPGIFELNRMGSFSCPGLTLFLRLSNFQKGNKDLLQAFDLMIETARQLVEDLGGEVCDEQRQPLTDEKMNDWRSYLAYYERSRQIPDLFA